jgi:hypothetical protein
MACDTVDESGVYLTTGNPLPADIELVVNWLLNEDFTTAFRSECCVELTVASLWPRCVKLPVVCHFTADCQQLQRGH